MLQTAGSIDSVITSFQNVDAIGANAMSIALIGPEERRRKAVAAALAGPLSGVTREFSSYPELDEVPRLIEQNYDVVIVDLDSNPEYALDLVESICGKSSATVMVYSAQGDPELMIRCMRAGAREFLTQPFSAGAIDEALVRASARRPSAHTPKKTGGKLFVFLGAKGGSGVTTLACNFALLLARESGQKTLLIDLDLPLGDIALGLGITAPYSTVDALQNFNRLDSTFLSKLVVKYSSGLSVLTAPGKFTNVQASKDAVDKLLAVARQDFDYVVVDSGSRLDLAGTALFEEDAMFYLVTQVGISELRNSNRLISEFFTADPSKLEIVVNRYSPSSLGVDEGHITKALTRPAQWRIPEDCATARRTQNTATPLALNDSPISRVILQMARTACGLPAHSEKKKRFGLFS
jgi:pilus assembly protein CpaE